MRELAGWTIALAAIGGAAAAFAGETVTVVINEVMPNPGSVDANGDSATGSGDEYVEIVNTSPVPVSLAGWELEDGVGARHLFASGTSLGPGCAIVVFGLPPGDAVSVGAAAAAGATRGALSLNNEGESVTLRDDGASSIDDVLWVTSTSGVALTRDPDLTGGFVEHHAASGSIGDLSPGRMVDGTSFGSGCSFLFAHDFEDGIGGWSGVVSGS